MQTTTSISSRSTSTTYEAYHKCFEIAKYLAVVGGYGYHIATVATVGPTHPTVGGGGGSVAAPVACGSVSEPPHPYAGYAVGLPPPPLQN